MAYCTAGTGAMQHLRVACHELAQTRYDGEGIGVVHLPAASHQLPRIRLLSISVAIAISVQRLPAASHQLGANHCLPSVHIQMLQTRRSALHTLAQSLDPAGRVCCYYQLIEYFIS